MKNAKRRCIYLMIFIGLFSSSCSQKCSVTCTSGVGLASVGYSFGELNTIILKLYVADGSFSNLVNSTVFLNRDTILYNIPNWLNLYVENDTVGDTLITNANELLNFNNDNYDIELIVPSNNNMVYRFSKITFVGPQSEKQQCKEGSPFPGSCGRTLASYVLNGNEVTNPYDGLLYFQK